MGLRFRKSINLGGVARINLSKKGFGWSVGTKGARYTKTADGKTRKTLSIPNTGLGYVTETSGKQSKKRAAANNSTLTSTSTNTPNKPLSIFFKAIGGAIIFLSTILSIVALPIGIAGIAIGAGFCFFSKRFSTKKY